MQLRVLWKIILSVVVAGCVSVAGARLWGAVAGDCAPGSVPDEDYFATCSNKTYCVGSLCTPISGGVPRCVDGTIPLGAVAIKQVARVQTGTSCEAGGFYIQGCKKCRTIDGLSEKFICAEIVIYGAIVDNECAAPLCNALLTGGICK